MSTRGGDADHGGPSIPHVPQLLHQPQGLGTLQSDRPVERHRMRMLLLDAVDEDRRDVDVLLTALQQAVAEVHGLGGMVHLPGGGMSGILYLVADSGLPETMTRPWVIIPVRGTAPPSRAARNDTTSWQPDLAPPDPVPGRDPAALWPSGLPAGIGHLAVPIQSGGWRRGALSVLFAPGAEPGAAEREFLTEVAAWMSGRLRASGILNPSPTLLRALENGPGPREAAAPWDAERMPSITYTWDLRTGALTADLPVEEVLAGIDPEVMNGGIEAWAELIHPDDLPGVVAGFDTGIQMRGGFQNEYRIRRQDGTYLWIEACARTITDEEGAPVKVIGTLRDSSETHAAAESVGRALRHMSDGFVSLDTDWRIGFLNQAAEQLLGAAGDVAGSLLWDIPVVSAVPGLEQRCRATVAEGQPAGFDVPGSDGRSWYHLRLVPVPEGLTLYITDTTERHLREAERAAAERAGAERAALVQRITRELAEAVTAQDVMAAVADGVMTPLGATGLVMVGVVGDRLTVVGSRGHSERFTRLLDGQWAVRETNPVGDALRTRAPLYISSPEEFLRRYPETDILIREGGTQAWAFLPLAVSGRGIGAAVICFGRPRVLDDDERTLLTALSGLIAQALERAGLYDEATTRARTLQRSLLPQELPELPEVTAAARYQPAKHGADVGGDWYDVIPLSAARVAFVIGDVMGHGMAEAATMGGLRTAVRTLSELELPPDEILGHLNDIVGEQGTDAFVTCLYGIYDPVTRLLSYASAGQPPPAVAHPDGTVTFLPMTPDPPLGVAAPPFETHETLLPADSLLALYSDGLVESKDRDVTTGMNRLAELLFESVNAMEALPADASDLDALCATLTSALLPAHGELIDDAALLLVRTHPLDAENVAEWPLPEDPVAAGQARDLARAQLDDWDLTDEDLVMTTELLVSELVGNVVRHACGPIRLRMLRSRALICEVSDASLTTPHIRHTSATDEGGRGLQLISALCQRWGTRHTRTGKSIWTEQPLPTASV
ncbi:SpoIIE family protein phosphatase [Streptomyces sp. HUAS TT20]|uniref:SpoIIE family protein phosphatase n=1 Tax=Streptomyces sp. HUAS TT20 TaxID=3447509 RepID=UPI0021D86F42|nr:SpoIIE family protein phosphatase [Streptomyces sp. HUAS 15-9]UXY25572.1 SpoIIE family protein phosphatase [Streptomyces sp. HUAS 15-9]